MKYNYPMNIAPLPGLSQVFALEKEADITRHYMNALKQALYLQLGSSRVGMSLAKDKQTRLWQAVKSSKCRLSCYVSGHGGQS